MDWLPDTTLSLVYGVACPLVAFVAVRLGSWLTALKAFKMNEAPWTERARFAYPVWYFNTFSILALLLLLGFVGPSFSELDHSFLSNVLPGITALLVFFASAAAQAKSIGRLRGIHFSAADGLRNWIIIILIFIPHIVVFVAMMPWLSETFDASSVSAMAIAAGLVLLLNFGGYLWLLRLIRILQPASDRLLRIAARAESGTEPHAEYFLLRWNWANALAFPLKRKIAFTDCAMAELTDEELEVICVHELEHLREPALVRYARLLTSFVWLPVFAGRPIIGSIGLGGWFCSLVAAYVVAIFIRRMARAMEVRADAAGHKHQANEGLYAQALEKLYAVNLMPAVLRQNNLVHPHLYDRLLASGITPDYPRPNPPPRWPLFLGLAGTLAVAGMFLFLCSLVRLWLLDS